VSDRWQIVPYLRVSDGEAAIEFYAAVFGAVELFRYPMPGGKIGFAELGLHGTVLQLADADYAENTPVPGPAAITLHVRVEGVDSVFAEAIAAGATPEAFPSDGPNSGRRAMFVDPFGHRWLIAEHVTTTEAPATIG
jgi:PhnB protein